MHGLLPEVMQSTTVPIKFVPPVSDLPSSVEAQTSATRASTSVVFAPGPLRCTVTGILVLEKLARGPNFLLEKMVPWTIFSGKIGPSLKILVPPEASSQNHPTLKILFPP